MIKDDVFPYLRHHTFWRHNININISFEEKIFMVNVNSQIVGGYGIRWQVIKIRSLMISVRRISSRILKSKMTSQQKNGNVSKTFGVIADIQYADVEDATDFRWHDRHYHYTKYQYTYLDIIIWLINVKEYMKHFPFQWKTKEILQKLLRNSEASS